MERMERGRSSKVIKASGNNLHSPQPLKPEKVISPLMFLPKELWTLIFNYIPQENRIQHRLVCKDWCKNIDEFSTVDVNFNADYPTQRHRERVFNLRIRCCTFSSLHIPFSPDFKNPLLVKEITFTTHVSAENVLKILEKCTNVESLNFLTTMSSETAFVEDSRSASVFNNLKNLQYLEIGILTFLDRTHAQESRTFKSIIGNENILFSSLKGLSIAFVVRHNEWYEIFKFLSRHSVTLKSLSVICPCGERLGNKERRSKDLIPNPNDLVLPQLDSLIVNGASDCSCREDVWLLLDQQKHLRRFESDIARGLVLMSDVIRRNQDTIRALKLHEVGSVFSDEIDCEIFSKCIKLQDLSLFVAGDCGCIIVVNVGGGTAQHRMPTLCRLDALPMSLRRLTLCGSQISTIELQKLFSPGRSLEEVTLGRADSAKGETVGMTITVLTGMLENLTRLRKLRIFLDMICELESSNVSYCSDLSGIWSRVFDLTKKINSGRSGNGNINDSVGERCCGEKSNDETCLGHRPYIDFIFKTSEERLEFLEKIKGLESKSTPQGTKSSS